MDRYNTLIAEHGTLEEFAEAIANALGEISMDEARNAIAKYSTELGIAKFLDAVENRAAVPVGNRGQTHD